LFAGVDEAKAKFQSNYQKEGTYISVITGCRAIRTRKKKDAVAIGLVCIQQVDVDKSKEYHGVGESYTWMPVLSEGNEASFLSRIKSFIGYTLGENPDHVSMADCKQMTSQAQPMTGMVVKVRQFKNDPEKPWVDMQFFTLSAEDVANVLTEEEIAKYLPEGIRNPKAATA
jgi:hypothetical protein